MWLNWQLCVLDSRFLSPFVFTGFIHTFLRLIKFEMSVLFKSDWKRMYWNIVFDQMWILTISPPLLEYRLTETCNALLIGCLPQGRPPTDRHTHSTWGLNSTCYCESVAISVVLWKCFLKGQFMAKWNYVIICSPTSYLKTKKNFVLLNTIKIPWEYGKHFWVTIDYHISCPTMVVNGDPKLFG